MGFDTAMTGISMVTQGIGTGMSMAAAKQEAERENLARQWNATVARKEAEVMELQAQDALKRGDIAADDQRRSYNKLRGQQRAAYSASGVDVNWGSAAAVQADTMAWGEYEAEKEIYNAEMEAWGHRQNARFKEIEAKGQLSGMRSSGLAVATAGINGAMGMAGTMTNWAKAQDWSKKKVSEVL